jgi:signal transduction histidine kinase/ligand-binding sensor domain-containing protein/DNA-binding response OmpR family regulator
VNLVGEFLIRYIKETIGRYYILGKLDNLRDGLCFLLMNKLTTIVIVALFIISVFSHKLSAQSNDINFFHLEKSISNNTGTTIYEDHKGFLWIGTSHGLNRYDGKKVLIYENDIQDSTSISNNDIRKVIEDKNGNLWIATHNGLNRYDRDLDRFHRYYHRPEDKYTIPINSVSDVLVDKQGRIWVAARYLCLYRPESDDFIRFTIKPGQILAERETYHSFIYQDLQGTIWYGSWRDLYRLNRHHQKLELYFNGNEHPFNDQDWNFHEMIQDTKGYFWLATNKAGLLRFKSGEEPVPFHDKIKKYERFSDFRLLTLFIDHNGFLWISCENNGLVVLDTDRNIRYRFLNIPGDENSISGNSIWSICQDEQYRMWFGLWNAGIDYIDPYNMQFTHYYSVKESNSISNDIVTDFIEDINGNLWIATDCGGGLNFFNCKTNTFSDYKYDPEDPASLSSNAVLCLAFDDQGRLWAGTYNGGINIYDVKRGGFVHFTTENCGLHSNHVFDLLNDGNGKMFIATYNGGLNTYDLKTGEWENYSVQPENVNSISSNNISVLYRDCNNNIWVGTFTEGLNLFVKDTTESRQFKRFQYSPNIPESISDNCINSLYEDRYNRLWIGTSNGLNLMNRDEGTFNVINKKDGLLTNYISGITDDTTGNLWISSLKGITRIDSSLQKFQHYDVTDNLQGYYFNKNSVYKMSNGNLLFGGTNGFNLFNPQEIKKNPHSPRLVFTDLKIFNQSVPIDEKGILKKHISETRHVTLTYRHSVFSLEFVALNFTQPEKNQYAYMMEGFDNKWIFSGTQNNATYTNLDAGDYIFRVKAANNDDVWNEQGINLHITIKPPFWRTWWAYIIYVLIILMIFYLIMRYRLTKQKLRYDLGMEHMKLEKLYEVDKIKSRFFSNVSHEFRTPIMLIVGPLENLLKSEKISERVKNKIKLIIRNAQRLSRLLGQLVDFYRIESPDLRLNLAKNDIVEFVNNIFMSFKEYARQHKIEFSFTSNISYGLTWFDADIIDKIIFNFLSNAFKFTPDGGEIEIGLNYRPSEAQSQNHIEIFVRDTGVGIPEEQLDQIFERFYQIDSDETPISQGIGIGLHMTQELVELIQGEIKVESKPGKGTIFRVFLPADILDLTKLPEKQAEQSWQESAPIQMASAKSEYTFTEDSNSTAIILFVEDELDVQQYIKDIFGNHFKIITANNGEDGLKKAIEFVPDLIISDIMMPKMDGFQLCSKIKSKEETSHIPVILLTVQSEGESKLKGIKSGADAYLPKPFNPEELMVRVQNLLKMRQKIRAKFRRQMLLEPRDESVKSLDEKFLVRVKQEVEKKLSDWRLDADTLSRAVEISRMQLYRKLKGLTGQTVHEFIRTIRLQRAVQLLKQCKMTITEICYYVGFNDLNYFSRCFRKQYGKSPSEYRTTIVEGSIKVE